MRHIAAWTWCSKHDARAARPQRREERHAVPDLDEAVGPSPAPGQPAEGAAREDAVATRLAHHRGTRRVSRCDSARERPRCASTRRCRPGPRPPRPDGHGARSRPPRGPRSRARRGSARGAGRSRGPGPPRRRARPGRDALGSGSRVTGAGIVGNGGDRSRRGPGVAARRRGGQPVGEEALIGANRQNPELTIDLGQPIPPQVDGPDTQRGAPSRRGRHASCPFWRLYESPDSASHRHI